MRTWMDRWERERMHGWINKWMMFDISGLSCLSDILYRKYLLLLTSLNPVCWSSIFMSFIFVSRSWNSRWKHLLLKIKSYFELPEVKAVSQENKSPFCFYVLAHGHLNRVPPLTCGDRFSTSQVLKDKSHTLTHSSFIHLSIPFAPVFQFNLLSKRKNLELLIKLTSNWIFYFINSVPLGQLYTFSALNIESNLIILLLKIVMSIKWVNKCKALCTVPGTVSMLDKCLLL